MKNEYFESIKEGLEDAVAFAQGDHTRATISHVSVLDIQALCRELGFTQEQFSRLVSYTL